MKYSKVKVIPLRDGSFSVRVPLIDKEMERFKRRLPVLIRKKGERQGESRKKKWRKFLTSFLGKSPKEEEGKKIKTRRVKEEDIQFLVISTALSKEEVEEISNELVRKILKKRRREEKKKKGKVEY